MNSLTIYRSASPLVTIPIDEKTTFYQKLMTEHRITTEFFSVTVLDITIGDYLTHASENFYINRLPSVTKLNNRLYQYRIDFESVWYDLKKKLFISTDGLAEYGYTGTATYFVTNIVANMNVNGTGWTVGTVDTTDEKTIIFSNESCGAALIKVAETFGLEFSIATKSISLVASVGNDTILTFEYGKNDGLYKLTREQVSDQNIVTRVYGFGSTANIPYGYRNRAKRLVFETGTPAVRYLEKNNSLYGVIEGQYTNDDIFPNRTAALTAVNMEFDGNDYNLRNSYVEDSALEFDINDYLIEGMEAMIVFKSGDLSGQEFVIWKYDDATKRIYFNPQSDEDGYTTPNPLNVAAVGDLYTLVNISLPQSYIDTAEAALLAATQAYLDENSVPMVVYSVEIDPKFARTNEISLSAGDRVTVVDTDLGINALIRIASIEYPLSNVYKIKAVIADYVPYTITERVIQKTTSTLTETRIIDRTSDELARRNAMRQRQLRDLIFDSDGYFDQERIKPLSVETMYLSVGAKSQNFRLIGVTIQCNYLGDANRLYCSTGELHHFEIPDASGFDWVIGSAYDTGADYMDPDTAYYLYAKCNKSSAAATWELTTSQLAADGNDGYYHFLVGVIYTVVDGVRDFDLTYGMTYINGRTITTGRIRSIDGLCYMDLTNGTFKIGDENHSLDWGVTAAGQLTLIGSLVQRSPGEYFPILLFRGAYSPTTVYHKGDMVTYNSATWIYTNDTSASGVTPEEGAYWTLASSVGEAGADGASPVGIFRGDWNIGTDYYGTTSRVDIVRYSDGLYYIAKPTAGNPFRGIVPTNTTYWSSFGANFESVATSLLFAETAYLDNVVVRQFEGIPVGVGDLAGSVVNTQANAAGTPRIDYVTLSGTSGSANITCNGVTRLATFESDLSTTAFNFVRDHYNAFYAAGVMVNDSGNTLNFTAMNGQNFSGPTAVSPITGDLDGTFGTSQEFVAGQKRIDTVTLTGTGGSADITCDNLRKRCIFSSSLETTASTFVTLYAAAYLEGGVVVTSSGADIIFTSEYTGQDFTGATSITNVASLYQGALSIAGNDIWDNLTNSNNAGILVNMKGYNGGSDYYRAFYVGNGKGPTVLFAVGHDSVRDKDMIALNAPQVQVIGLPHSGSGLDAGMMYVDANGYLKLAGY
jgi:hypothetical protein